MAKKRRQEPEPEEEEEEDIADEELPDDDDNDDISDHGEDDEQEEEMLSSEDEDNDNGAPEPTPLPVLQACSIKSDGRYQNKQRLLVLSSRGVTARYRHLLEDLRTLLPHSKKECKLDVGEWVDVACDLFVCIFSSISIRIYLHLLIHRCPCPKFYCISFSCT
jgi:hypothetical protein